MDKIPNYDALDDQHCRNYASNVKKSSKFETKTKVHGFAPSGLRALKDLRSGKEANASVESKMIRIFALGTGQIKVLQHGLRKRDAGIHMRKKGKLHSLINQETVSALLEEMDYLWEIYRIDQHYKSAYLESLSRLQMATYIQLLAKEIENLYNEKAAIQQLYSAIQKREEQVKYIKELNQFLLGGKASLSEMREKV